MSQTIKVNKREIIEKIRHNWVAHRAIYEDAMEGYRAEAITRLNEYVDQLKAGKSPRIVFVLPVPEDHTDDYKAILAMLEAHVDKTIEIDEYEFRCYVLDEWDWKDRFLTTAANYNIGRGRK